MILVPMNNYVLIEETYKEEKTKSGLILSGEQTKQYVVRGVSSDVSLALKEGDEVLVFNIPGCVKLEGNRFGEHMMLCTQEQIMGVIKNE